jgi:branched-chain amino acid transport system substrate-binding protein
LEESFNMKRVYSLLAVLIVLSLVLVGCKTETEAPPAVEPTEKPMDAEPTEKPKDEEPMDEEPIVIGASLPLTGMFQTAGEGHKLGYEMCVDLINERGGLLGRQVEVIYEDNRSDTEIVVSQYERFISVEEVDLLFGTFSTLLSFPASSIAEQNKMVWLEPADSSLISHGRGYQYIFGMHQNAIDYIGQTPVAAVEAYRDSGVISDEDFPVTAAVVYADDFFPNGISNGLLGGSVEVPGSGTIIDLAPGFLAEAGIEVIYTEQWPEGYTDWVSLAANIKNADADFLFALTVPPSEIDIIKALQTVDYNPKGLFLSQGTQYYFLEGLGDAVNGAMIFTTWHPEAEWAGLLAGEEFTNSEFVEIFTERYGREPSEDESVPFSVCQALEQAVRATESLDNTVLRDWLAARTASEPVKTIQGEYYWDETGMPVDRHYILTQWQNEELEFVYPIGEFPGVSDLLWPKPAW